VAADSPRETNILGVPALLGYYACKTPFRKSRQVYPTILVTSVTYHARLSTVAQLQFYSSRVCDACSLTHTLQLTLGRRQRFWIIRMAIMTTGSYEVALHRARRQYPAVVGPSRAFQTHRLVLRCSSPTRPRYRWQQRGVSPRQQDAGQGGDTVSQENTHTRCIANITCRHRARMCTKRPMQIAYSRNLIND
jgi:hypothetical protein